MRKLTCKDVGKLATNDQRCIKNTDPARFVRYMVGGRGPKADDFDDDNGGDDYEPEPDDDSIPEED
jgi:hypothetical protein